MNIVLLPADAKTCDLSILTIDIPRQLQHLKTQLNVQLGDTLKVGMLNEARYLTEIIAIQSDHIRVRIISAQSCPAKLPVTLIVALPRPKVLRRLIMDSVTLGVDKIVLMHSYRVDKSYWQTPFLQKLEEYVTLGLEQAGDVFTPEISLEKRFKPFVEDRLSKWTQQQPTFVAHPYAEQPMPVSHDLPCQLVIGPEGGFIPYEIELLQQNGCQIRTLGSRILRTETAIPNILGRMFA